MLSYLLISIPFIIMSTFCIKHILKIDRKSFFYVLAGTLVLTAIFDSLIIWLGIYDYNVAKTLGLVIGRAPIEDFLYAVFAASITIYVWEKSQ